MQINDAVMESLWLALGSVAFALLLPVSALWAFGLAFGSSFLLAAAALLLVRRLRG